MSVMREIWGNQRIAEKAVERCIELMDLKYPDNLIEISERSFIHTNTKGKKMLSTAYGTFSEYNTARHMKKQKVNNTSSVMTFFITEEVIEG